MTTNNATAAETTTNDTPRLRNWNLMFDGCRFWVGVEAPDRDSAVAAGRIAAAEAMTEYYAQNGEVWRGEIGYVERCDEDRRWMYYIN
jgi:hypothetical protein